MKKIFLLIFAFVLSFALVVAEFNFDNGVSGTTSTQFDTTSGAPKCIATATSAVWKFYDDTTVNAILDCYRANGVSSGGVKQENCCPLPDSVSGIDYTCELDSASSKYKCVEKPIEGISCDSYTTEEECGGFNLAQIENFIYSALIEALGPALDAKGIELNVDEDDLEFCTGEAFGALCDTDYCKDHSNDEICKIYAGCRCIWGRNQNNEFECMAHYEKASCPGIGPDIPIKGCEYQNIETQNLCDEDEEIYLVSWTVEQETDTCTSGYKEFPCPAKSTLPFFTWFNFIIAGLAIVGIYFFMRKK